MPNLDSKDPIDEVALDSLFEKSFVEDIVVSSRGLAYFSEGSWKGPFASRDASPEQLTRLSRLIAEAAGTVLGLSNPSVDAYITLPNSTVLRAHVVIAPMSTQGTEITFRRLPSKESFSLSDFCDDSKTLDQLDQAVQQGLSILVAGGTGSGKTSLLTALMRRIPTNTRLLILEDSPELPLPNGLSSKLIARTNRFGMREGATWDLSHLVFESLRMRPDRLVLGECRGPEALAIATALQTGHAGVMTSLHAGSALEATRRFLDLVELGRQHNGTSVQVSNSKSLWDLVIHIEQESQAPGRRRIRELQWKN